MRYDTINRIVFANYPAAPWIRLPGLAFAIILIATCMPVEAAQSQDLERIFDVQPTPSRYGGSRSDGRMRLDLDLNIPRDRRVREIRVTCHDRVGNTGNADLMLYVENHFRGRLEVNQRTPTLVFRVDLLGPTRVSLIPTHKETVHNNLPPLNTGDEVEIQRVEIFAEKPTSDRPNRTAQPSARARVADFDRDGIPDRVEQDLLERFGPVLYHHDDGQMPPLPIWWVAAQGHLREYQGNTRLRVHEAGRWQPDRITGDNEFRIRLGEPNDRAQRGKDRWSRRGMDIEWPHIRNQSHPIHSAEKMRFFYGRVCPNEDGRGGIGVMYFLYRAWNETTFPNNLGGCGIHEGDWMSVDLDVRLDAMNTQSARIDRMIVHNHGRQIFVEPRAIQYEQQRPVLYIEKGTNEPFHFASDTGLHDGNPDIPQGTSTNEIFRRRGVLGRQVGGEHGEWPAIRAHSCRHHRLVAENIINVGEGSDAFNPDHSD